MAYRDDTDRALLAALKADGRASITELAHRLSIARATVKQRLDRLINSGVIRKFTIVTDTEDDGEIRAIMTVELQGSLSRSVTRALRGIPEITELYSTNGAWDLVAEIRTATLVEFDRVLREVREISGVLNSETSLLLDRMR
ncbi:MAG: Lrp/AsnC family transcriptional regulator [Rhodobacteraceae bacterium]|nr:Lrp/AsnC family transcriptional regulator [Paracoccaceae bacterium]